MNNAAPSQSRQALPPDAGERERIVRRAALVSAGTGLSRILGFARDMLIAHFLGAGPVADVFLAVLRLPNILRRLLTEGAVAMPFTPLYLNLARTEGETRANAFARAARAWAGGGGRGAARAMKRFQVATATLGLDQLVMARTGAQPDRLARDRALVASLAPLRETFLRANRPGRDPEEARR